MEMVLSSGFCEMSFNEVEMIDGGVQWGTVLAGAGIVVASVGLTLATGGIGVCSIPLILGAGTSTEIAVAATALVTSTIGSVGMSYGLMN